MSSSSCLAMPVLLILAVAASAQAATGEEPQAKRILLADVAGRGLHKEGSAPAETSSAWPAEKKDVAAAAALEGKRLAVLGGGGVATQGDEQGSASASGGGEHGKEEGGSSKEGEKQGKGCVSKEECHKKRLICGKGCTLSAHTKCAAKCSKSCVATC